MSYSSFQQAQPVQISGSATSYFSSPSEVLDPALFDGTYLRPWVRNSILNLVTEHLSKFYESPKKWATVWLAGSGVSYQWQAQRDPADLDCLVGVDYVTFRGDNPEYRGLSDTDISHIMNDEFQEHLMPVTSSWNGFELTFYVNPGATDISSINPYAAYDLTHDKWTVEPDPRAAAPYTRAWQQKADTDLQNTHSLIQHYSQALTDIQNASNPAHRVNAEAHLHHVLSAASSMYDEIHGNRRIAFSLAGAGYADFNNWRWQAGKQSGAVPALRTLRDYSRSITSSNEVHTYGMELPSVDVLVRRAAIHRQ